ncbi:MAG: hypothetical protein HF981_13075 [Desulfobacteraceae bacterium]|nr:hypothetical protein [Desulfobacteraceae bacterium]MBC2751314.1 hypothetical protein [Desulfobacteraceae bacterium]
MKMKSFDNKCLSFSLMLFTCLITCSCGAPIEKYEPRSQDEKEIVSVLVEYQEAKNGFDLERLLYLLHEKGEFTFQCGMMVSKNRLKEMLPGFWAKLSSGDSAVIPIVHECINGDYYNTGKLHNLQIEIHRDKALATVLFAKGVCRVPLYVTMRREDARWLITRTEWGES